MDHNPEIRQRLFDQFSQTVVAEGWRSVSCAEIATRANIDIKLAFLEYRDRFAYVSDLVRRIDAAMLEAFDPDMGEEPARERLFDVIMARFDAMQGHRELILALNKAARYDPMLTLHLLALSRLTGEWFLDISRISPAGFSGMARSKGALLAYARAFAVWMEDDSTDLAKTMATLDKFLKRGEKALRRAEKIACILPRIGKRCRSARSRGKGSDKTAQDSAIVSEGPSVDDGSMAPMPS
ncbi:hypothetical protein [uncultured Cohaesibacter sp.]|uniref:hypothetical protein n=1 Tax=uncultured Cohaesibacter sp. TaxID=1002546 RepID=UPI0029C81968|nr:hypothetical protein [uncultured Cohaesibacter sp.]